MMRRPVVPRGGWPKTLACLVCGRLRLAQHAGDRLHDGCRARARSYADAEARGVVRRP